MTVEAAGMKINAILPRPLHPSPHTERQTQTHFGITSSREPFSDASQVSHLSLSLSLGATFSSIFCNSCLSFRRQQPSIEPGVEPGGAFRARPTRSAGLARARSQQPRARCDEHTSHRVNTSQPPRERGGERASLETRSCCCGKLK